ncbi:MAG TPA: YqaJ viral recombinase family protein [Geothrix sp.]|nr:YqaJ viral recombinase family protein [Geothrix sp.]
MTPFAQRIISVTQGTPEWKAARAGKVTATRTKDVIAKGKGNAESASRADLRMTLVCETLTGEPEEEGFVSKEMLRGTEMEPFARAAYEASEGVMVDQVGMVLHPNDPRCAASPDGLVNWDGTNAPEGLIEIKAPKTKTHIGYIEAGVVPSEYQPQMLWQMACTGAQWVDFVSYDPRLPEALQLFIIRFHRDEARIQEMEREVSRFLDEVDATANRLKQIADEAA